jgi:hypothetical protein
MRQDEHVSEDGDITLTAYRIFDPAFPIVPAPPSRDWMEATDERNALRCLPMLIANQSGWLILNTHRVVAVWDGGDKPPNLHIQYHPTNPPYPQARSIFGYGILTWTIPYLFRTPPGYNLHARGPANMPKDGISALEGIVEADWSESTFTMNWKLTRPKHPVVFDVDEPICMIVPTQRSELERVMPRVRPLGDEPDLQARLEVWRQSRAEFQKQLQIPGTKESESGWQRHYFQGQAITGTVAPEHQTRLRLGRFEECDAT